LQTILQDHGFKKLHHACNCLRAYWDFFANIRIVKTKNDHGHSTSNLAIPVAALTRVMRASVPIPTLASASVLQSAAVGGSVVGVVGPL